MSRNTGPLILGSGTEKMLGIPGFPMSWRLGLTHHDLEQESAKPRNGLRTSLQESALVCSSLEMS